MERTALMDEYRARDTLYGPQNRSGLVSVVEGYEPYEWIEGWMDEIVWNWPIYGVRRDSHACDF